MNTRLILAVIVTTMFAACERPAVDFKAKGAGLLAPFKAELQGALKQGMEAGPVAAISVCSVEAPGISARLSVDGVLMGRSSHKLRNYRNATPEWLAPVLRGYADGSTNLEPLALEIEEGRMGYVEPIIVQPMCLACHGESLAPDIAAKISEAYPDDQATGFKVGDFRGVFWVEFPEY